VDGRLVGKLRAIVGDEWTYTSEHELRTYESDGLLQYQADIMQLPVVRPQVTETTALGAAYLAGMAIGVWKGREAIAGHWKVDRRFEPQMSGDEAAAIRARWNDAVRRSQSWAKEE